MNHDGNDGMRNTIQRATVLKNVAMPVDQVDESWSGTFVELKNTVSLSQWTMIDSIVHSKIELRTSALTCLMPNSLRNGVILLAIELDPPSQ